MSGRVTSIDVDLSNPDIIYAGTASGGVWKSASGGIAWEPIFDDAYLATHPVQVYMSQAMKPDKLANNLRTMIQPGTVAQSKEAFAKCRDTTSVSSEVRRVLECAMHIRRC